MLLRMQDFDDDGESAAGSRLCKLLQIKDVTNVLVLSWLSRVNIKMATPLTRALCRWWFPDGLEVSTSALPGFTFSHLLTLC